MGWPKWARVRRMVRIGVRSAKCLCSYKEWGEKRAWRIRSMLARLSVKIVWGMGSEEMGGGDGREE